MSKSLVKMDCQAVRGLCVSCIERCRRAREVKLRPFIVEIHTQMAKKNWLGRYPSMEDVIASKSFSWKIDYAFAKDVYNGIESLAEKLLLATTRSADGFIMVSIDDLWRIR